MIVPECDIRWTYEGCPSGGGPLDPPAASNPAANELASVPADQQSWILLDVGLPANPAVPQFGSATHVLPATGAGEEPSSGGTVGPRSAHGTDPFRPLLTAVTAMAAGLLGAFPARWGRPGRFRKNPGPR
ncbi:hypothetical protein OIT41_02600 [Arthrobacter sp. YA7-1]|uniref:hypothetical protein n=1 Tax=Arthrobacter sp. YA7-1 TaxID=2987701 RepID=UPI002226D43F|nr:hypothetical protein [Arthrobacter sp. YA7-1]UYY81984.1 hypothetical protein OIT41_02600 [Arthrobacter sp. YA7-1]